MAGASPCASCKLLRRRCAKDCIFAPHFPPDNPHKFAVVHKLFGASNVAKMLQELPVDQREDGASSLVYEAEARMRDPVYGCVGTITYLQDQISQLQLQLAITEAEILCIKTKHHHRHHHRHQAPPLVAGLSALPSSIVSSQAINMQHQAVVEEKSPFFFSTTTTTTTNNNFQQYLGFASSSNVMQDALKKGSLWT